jgi:hypothetical protein
MSQHTTTYAAPPLRTLWARSGYWARAWLVPAGASPAPAEPGDRPSGDWVGATARDGVLRIGLADVEGKGNGVATYHDHLLRLLHALPGASLPDFVAALHGSWPGLRFASLALLDLDLHRGRFTTAQAGHPDAFLRHADGSVTQVAGQRFGLLGIDLAPDPTPVHEHEFAPGQAVVLFSDGVLDAGISRGERFGAARLVQAIGEAPSPAAIFENVRRRVERHLNGWPPEDDLSLVVVSRCGCGTGVCCAGERPAEAETSDPWTLLLLQAQAGDAAALARLLAEATPLLVGRLRRLLGNRDDACEVAQAVALRIKERLASFDPRRGSASAIPRNKVCNVIGRVE